jgi:hypothetical protein
LRGSREIRFAWLGLALIAVGAITALWAAGELSGGLVELPRHWWSTLATLPITVGIVVTAVSLTRLARSPSGDRARRT